MIRVILADQCAVLDDKGLEHVTAEARSLLESTDKTFELMETHAKNVVKGVCNFSIIYSMLLYANN